MHCITCIFFSFLFDLQQTEMLRCTHATVVQILSLLLASLVLALALTHLSLLIESFGAKERLLAHIRRLDGGHLKGRDLTLWRVLATFGEGTSTSTREGKPVSTAYCIKALGAVFI